MKVYKEKPNISNYSLQADYTIKKRKCYGSLKLICTKISSQIVRGFFLLFFTILFYYFFFLFYVLFPSRRIFLGSRLFLFSFTYNSIQYKFFFISVNEHIFLHVFHVLTPKTRISYNYIWSKYVVYLEHWDTSSDTAYVDVFTLHVPTFSLMYFFFRWTGITLHVLTCIYNFHDFFSSQDLVFRQNAHCQINLKFAVFILLVCAGFIFFKNYVHFCVLLIKQDLF